MSINRWLYWSKKTYAVNIYSERRKPAWLVAAAFSMRYGFPHYLYYVGNFNDENQHIVVVDEAYVVVNECVKQSQR